MRARTHTHTIQQCPGSYAALRSYSAPLSHVITRTIPILLNPVDTPTEGREAESAKGPYAGAASKAVRAAVFAGASEAEGAGLQAS